MAGDKKTYLRIVIVDPILFFIDISHQLETGLYNLTNIITTNLNIICWTFTVARSSQTQQIMIIYPQY